MASSNTIMVLCSNGLLLLDLIGAYLVHFVEHKTKFLWRFHLIHHTDTWVDTTSANRHHPGKVLSVYIYHFGSFNCRKSYVDVSYTKRYQLLQLNLTMLTLHYQKVGHYYELLIVSRHA
jgi:sterol desaturase/sphingolipid hydroxylase (fatty acid hydroxylase superfamily)